MIKAYPVIAPHFVKEFLSVVAAQMAHGHHAETVAVNGR
jgi:hypothetical protein